LSSFKNIQEELADNDPGDETQRNYRYQHAYGVILLIAAASKKLPYSALYAEHHEDFLCEKEGGEKYVGYQVKTRKPEYGFWELLDEPLKKSIKRFVELVEKFGSQISTLNFVSNLDFSQPSLDIKDQKKLGKSPIRFSEHIQGCSSFLDIAEPYKTTFVELEKYCSCSSELLFLTLKKIGFVLGPERNSFDSDISATHLPTLDECKHLDITQLHAIRDELIQKVYHASSLKIDDASKHFYPVNFKSINNPTILAKRVAVSVVSRTITDRAAPPFRYSKIDETINLGAGKENASRLRKKMVAGNLALQTQTMERRGLSSEQRLIQLAIRDPQKFDQHLNQLVSVVKAECDEAYNHAIVSSTEPFGPEMLDDVFVRLRRLSSTPAVYNEQYETLVGISGLLTGECQIWWSKPFDLEKVK